MGDVRHNEVILGDQMIDCQSSIAPCRMIFVQPCLLAALDFRARREKPVHDIEVLIVVPSLEVASNYFLVFTDRQFQTSIDVRVNHWTLISNQNANPTSRPCQMVLQACSASEAPCGKGCCQGRHRVIDTSRLPGRAVRRVVGVADLPPVAHRIPALSSVAYPARTELRCHLWATLWLAADGRPGQRPGRHADASAGRTRRDALVVSTAGRPAGGGSLGGTADLAASPGAAMADGDVQVLHRSRAGRQGHRCGRAVSEPTRERDRAQHR
jgi:hypothetical protein